MTSQGSQWTRHSVVEADISTAVDGSREAGRTERDVPGHAQASRQPQATPGQPAPDDEPLQITMSPYFGTPDFSGLARRRDRGARLDPVSVADLLRNGFVYAPHSIFETVKLATVGFDPEQDMHGSPEYRFMFPSSGRCREASDVGQDWVGTYHRLLCTAVSDSCADFRSPWLLQSGGKDSTPLAIAAAEVRPDTTCITYLGGSEENEVASAMFVARKLGLRHETLVCDPGRAYDRYLAIVDRMPLLTADFALLSYVDLATTILEGGGDGVIDGMGADVYFGWPMHRQERLLSWLARNMKLPRVATELPLVDRNFKLCYLLSTLQMDPVERVFPGSRFTDAEVDELFGRDIARRSKSRLELFRAELAAASNIDEWQAMASSIAGPTSSIAKGLYTTSALGLGAAYPFCDTRLRDWVYHQVPEDQLVDPVTKANKVLVRKHIATRFEELPYVARKGSFRFDLCGLARQRFDQVHAFAEQTRDVLPGAVGWLERNRGRLDNKYHASKFYLLAIVLPWLARHGGDAKAQAPQSERRMQITMSPYYGRPDFSALKAEPASKRRLDPVSAADLLRNGFVYPPHSIIEDVKLATLGFDPQQDMGGAPDYRFMFRDSGKCRKRAGAGPPLVDTYHRMLCDAVARSCSELRAPWLLQSGGKDSTSIAIAASEARSDTTCLTYLGGREENEIASATAVAQSLGLRHEILICDPGRAYDRYLAIAGRMPLLTADFALLSYVDLATTIADVGGDGVIDGLGSDSYFGVPVSRQQRLLSWLARGIRLPHFAAELPLINRSFRLSYGLTTLQMDPVERIFPGSRFTDAEVDELFGYPIARASKARLERFRRELDVASSLDEMRTMAITIEESASAFAKGLYTASALSLQVAYPFCDRRLREWVYHEVPVDQLINPVTRTNKPLVRKHIAERFGQLPYVAKKGSFRFDLCGLALSRFDQVHAYAIQAADVLPGAAGWLERNRNRVDTKYHASKFYLLAIVLPWIVQHDLDKGSTRVPDA
ncbi:asparagine synthase-related protein [Novilysobacter erysipheiresistens]|uniref:asparagine synthase (glutamine-hydrolyzing) n=1 Tax=Novilysobacter erysipheiresistens TaxID=1749332 RepID=A0ABU7Z1T2_9GAMM